MVSDPDQRATAEDELALLRRRLAELEAENARLRLPPTDREALTLDSLAAGLLDLDREPLMQVLADSINDVIWITDLALTPRYVSPAVEHLRGYSVAESLTQRLDQIFSPSSVEMLRRRLRKLDLSRSGERAREPVEAEIIRRDGTTVWTETTVSVLRDPAGEPMGLLGVTRDISDRRRVREELISRTRTLESIFQNLDEIFFSLDVESGQLLQISPACESVYGVSPAEFYAHPHHWFELIHPDDQERIQAGYRAMIAGDRDQSQAEYRIRRPDGTVRWLQSRIKTLRNAAGRVERIDGFVADITDQKRLEEQVRQAQKMEAVGSLAGGVAHDMNNVLGVVMGLASVLQADLEPDSPLRRHVESILTATKRGRNLARNLLDFARRSKGRRKPLSVNHIIEEVIVLFQRTTSRNIRVVTQLDGTLDPVLVNPGELNHALMNLLLNAADAMAGRGTISISSRSMALDLHQAATLPGLSPGRYARLRVQDTGVGMASEILEHALEPFFTTKPKGQGTGLGLSMVYTTVTKHGGAVRIDSEPGQGTTVTIYLPTVEADFFEAQERPQKPAARRPARGTVLLVDDEPMFRLAGSKMLQKAGFEVLQAENGSDALRAFSDRRQEIRLVMLDLEMPVMDGEETYHALRQLDPDVPVLVITGFSRDGRSERLLNAGAQGFLHKPFDLDALIQELSRVMPGDG